MATVDWLPRSTDTRVILAAAYNEFFKNAEIAVIPSDGELDRPYEPLPPSVNAFGTLKIARIAPELARSIHTIIHAPKRAFSWGVIDRKYIWADFFSFRIYLARYKGEQTQSTMFPILYGDPKDVDAVLGHAGDDLHQSMFKALGLAQSQLAIATYLYDERSGWSLKQ